MLFERKSLIYCSLHSHYEPYCIMWVKKHQPWIIDLNSYSHLYMNLEVLLTS